eukprot:GHVU01199625.1.p1 GENE.GHVU01199625.1~~GHVU01199625.1.p1  ORF type:complete len:185 (+),score=15.23 GHVU01199625.1:1103-1657(+)
MKGRQSLPAHRGSTAASSSSHRSRGSTLGKDERDDVLTTATTPIGYRSRAAATATDGRGSSSSASLDEPKTETSVGRLDRLRACVLNIRLSHAYIVFCGVCAVLSFALFVYILLHMTVRNACDVRMYVCARTYACRAPLTPFMCPPPPAHVEGFLLLLLLAGRSVLTRLAWLAWLCSPQWLLAC